jgi:hypothetical protein
MAFQSIMTLSLFPLQIPKFNYAVLLNEIEYTSQSIKSSSVKNNSRALIPFRLATIFYLKASQYVGVF